MNEMFKTVIENLPMVFSLLMGMGLIVLEVFLPGFGLPGISGIALVGVGTVLACLLYTSRTCSHQCVWSYYKARSSGCQVQTLTACANRETDIQWNRNRI